jgi:hypothetical protein
MTGSPGGDRGAGIGSSVNEERNGEKSKTRWLGTIGRLGLNDLESRGLYFEFGSLRRLRCSGDLRLDDSLADVLPIAVAAASLVEVEIVYFSNCRVLQPGEWVGEINALPALMACLVGHW